MALKVELKPGERIIIGDTLLTNSDTRARFFIEGEAPILREKDIYTKESADSPAKRIYFVIQLMYLDRDQKKYIDMYRDLINDISTAAPTTLPFIDAINNQMLTGNLYKALKEAKSLIDYEEKLLSHATSR